MKVGVIAFLFYCDESLGWITTWGRKPCANAQRLIIREVPASRLARLMVDSESFFRQFELQARRLHHKGLLSLNDIETVYPLFFDITGCQNLT
jgi:hypothetical protein